MKKPCPRNNQHGFSHIELLVVIAVLAVIGFGAYLWWTNQETSTLRPGTAEFSQRLQADLFTGPARDPNVPLAPQIKFDKYTLAEGVSFPQVPAQIKVYSLKSNLSIAQASQAPKELGLSLDPNLSSQGMLALTNFEDPENLGYWVVNSQNGSFQFRSYGNHRPQGVAKDASPTQIAKAFLKENNLWDGTLTATATYQLREESGTYVEFHRDWEKVGLPILSSAGLLNVPPEDRVSKLKLGEAASYMLDDEQIVNSSDGMSGKKRPDDFNTLTVKVLADGRVWSVTSNLRPLEANAAELTSRDLKTPQEALSELRSGQGVAGLTAPAGEGQVDLTKVYPQNLARASQATVTDFTLAYLEKHAEVQKYLQPVYIFRGQAKLETGYTVNWIQVVPAVKEVGGQTATTKREGLVGSAVAAENSTAAFYVTALGEFSFCRSVQPHVICFRPTSSTINTVGQAVDLFFSGPLRKHYERSIAQQALANPQLMDQFIAAQTKEELYPIFHQLIREEGPALWDSPECPSFSPAAPMYVVDGSDCNRMPQRYWNAYGDRMRLTAEQVAETIFAAATVPTPTPTPIPPTPTNAPTPTPTTPLFEPLGANLTVTAAFQKLAQRPAVFPDATLRGFYNLFDRPRDESETFTSQEPPIPNPPQRPKPIGGSSPYLFFYQDGKRANPQDEEILVKLPATTVYQELFADPIYYEYDPVAVQFSRSGKGFVIKREDWKRFLQETLAPKLKLTPEELQAWGVDLQKELAGAKIAPYLLISFISEEELNKQLPLQFNSQPDTVYRIHLMLTPLDRKVSLPQPQITPLERSSFTVIELGAYGK